MSIAIPVVSRNVQGERMYLMKCGSINMFAVVGARNEGLLDWYALDVVLPCICIHPRGLC